MNNQARSVFQNTNLSCIKKNTDFADKKKIQTIKN